MALPLGRYHFGRAEAQKEVSVRARIEVTPNIHFGKPCVAGTRIPGQSVPELVREGLSFPEIIREYYPQDITT